MTLFEFAEYGSTICSGECGLSNNAHRRGVVLMGVIHFADRRFSRRALRNLLLLVARREREGDESYLNSPVYDWYYLYLDNVQAAKWALHLGVRLPARLSRTDRLRCQRLAADRGVRLSHHPRVRSWVGDA
jgi:hypothetical protein